MLAEMLHLSRQKVQPFIKNGLVKVNWKTVEQTSYECYPGDVFLLEDMAEVNYFL